MSLTKSQYTTITNAGARVQRQTQVVGCVLSLAWTQSSIKNMNRYKRTSFKFDLSLSKIQYTTKNNDAAHVQRQTQIIEFDLSWAPI